MKINARLLWRPRAPLMGVHVDAEYDDLIDVMVGLGPVILYVEIRR